jgi:hypothetical protein
MLLHLHLLMECQVEDILLLHMVEEEIITVGLLQEHLICHHLEVLINLIMGDQDLIIGGEIHMRDMVDHHQTDMEVDIILLIIKWIEGAIWIEEEVGHMIWEEVDTTKEVDIIKEEDIIKIDNILIGILKVIQDQEEILNGKHRWQSKKFHLSLPSMQILY